jgi:uncharacterized PurR-regulated membrane protein YhhQ (DUF165 family)
MFKWLGRYRWSMAYLASIMLTMPLFKFYPLIITIAEGLQFSFWTLLVGAWFVLRDFSQREVGHYVFIPMILGTIVVALIDPFLAVASVLAVSASELTDWAVYTWTKRPFHQRILISSLVATPVDTIVFFWAFDYFAIIPGVSVFNAAAIVLGVASKMVAALVVFYLYHRQQQKVRAS